MHEILYRFLVKYKKLAIPGIGTVILHAEPAQSEYVSRSFFPPGFSFLLREGNESPAPQLFSWIAITRNVTEAEAVMLFNDFTFDLARQLKEGKEIVWNGVGVLRKELSGNIQLDQPGKKPAWLDGVQADKVTRGYSEHTMLVGENEKTSMEMSEMLLHPELHGQKPQYWWVWPVAVILAMLLFLGWYFSEYGLHPASSGNNKKITPAAAPAAHN